VRDLTDLNEKRAAGSFRQQFDRLLDRLLDRQVNEIETQIMASRRDDEINAQIQLSRHATS
jgi:hypothetical protein